MQARCPKGSPCRRPCLGDTVEGVRVPGAAREAAVAQAGCQGKEFKFRVFGLKCWELLRGNGFLMSESGITG